MSDFKVLEKLVHEDGNALHLEVEDGELKVLVPLDFWKGAEVGGTVSLPDDVRRPPDASAYLKLDF
jgi:hypothetical protein